jgi:AraC-like DNA-binding protein/MoxR-like ATPase
MRVRKQMEKTQKEYYLREQVRAIQKELGEKDDRQAEVDELRERIAEANLPEEVEEKAIKELERLEKMPPMVAEAVVVRNYLDWLLSLPWTKETRDRLKLDKAEEILEADHYGLKKPKERILEYLAIRKLATKMRGPIICFVGPPGVGKTSLGRSVAHALGRKFVRISLGGVRDEAEIRGHRRTYVGALPGRIIQGMKQAGSKNPVFLLDEVDKMNADFRGDPSSALLEVLDAEQNHAFSDHYIEVPFDLSKVMFITTANVEHNIPRPLLDRMEVIRLPGYTEEEKMKIAELHLIPKQLKEHGLKPRHLQFSDNALRTIIRQYTREAGVRNLEREIASVCRKTAREVVNDKKYKAKVTAANVDAFLGIPRFHFGDKEKDNEVGVATGLAWTEVGGSVLNIEVGILKGKGKITLTGKLGDVMKESAQAGLSFVRSRADELDLADDFHEKHDIHIHVPEGAIPKDGPSAGITMATALLSAVTGSWLWNENYNEKHLNTPVATKDDILALENEFFKELRLSHQESSKELLKRLAIMFFTHSKGKIEIIKGMSIEFISLLTRFSTECGTKFEESIRYSFQRLNELEEADTVEKVILWLLTTGNSYIDLLTEKDTDPQDAIINRAISFIRENYASQDLSLSTIADSCHISPSYLSRIFKQKKGHTITEQVNRTRIEEAKHILQECDSTVNETAQKVGFADRSYFYKVFKKQVGLSPSTYKSKF